jgi:flagellar biogenesis protein FliO
MPIAVLLRQAREVSGPQGPDLTRYLFVCLGLLGLVVLLAFLFRRFVAEHVKRRAAGRSLRIADVLPLGGKQKLVVVRCYDRSFLLGLGAAEVCSIAELDPQEPSAETTDEREAEPARTLPFRLALAESLRGVRTRREVPAAAPAPSATRRDEERAVDWARGEGILG